MKPISRFKQKIPVEHYYLNGYMNFSSLCEKEPESNHEQHISLIGNKCKQLSKFNIDSSGLNEELSKFMIFESNNISSATNTLNRILIPQDENYLNRTPIDSKLIHRRGISQKDFSENKQNFKECLATTNDNKNTFKKLNQNFSGDYLDIGDDSIINSNFAIFPSKVKVISPKIFCMDSQSSDERSK